MNSALPDQGQGIYGARSASQFQNAMSAKGASVQDNTINVNGKPTAVVQSSTTLNLPQGQQQVTTSLDPNLGYVVQSVSTMSTAEATEQATTTYSYQSLPGNSGLQWPSHIHSDATINATGVNITSTAAQDATYTNMQVNSLPASYFSVGGL